MKPISFDTLSSMERFHLLRESVRAWQRDKTSVLAASLAYYTIFSLPPLLLLAVSAASVFVRGSDIENELMTQLTRLMGERGTAAMETILTAIRSSEHSGIAAIIGVGILIAGATGVMVQLQRSLNTIWKVAPKSPGKLRHFLLRRLLSIALILAVGFLLIVSLILSTIASVVADLLLAYIPFFAYALPVLDLFVSFILVFLIFALLFKFVPDVRISWKDVWVGALLTAALYILGKTLIGFYLAHSTIFSAYGVAGSVIVLLLWVYYSSHILLFGAEFTKCYSELYGSRILPAEGAESLETLSHAERVWWNRVTLLWSRLIESFKKFITRK